MPALLAVAERAKGSLLLVFVERLIPLPSPRCPFAVLTIEFIGDQNKRAIDYGTVVVRQVHDPSFDTQPSELGKDMASDYSRGDPAKAFAERRGITFRERVAEIIRKVPEKVRGIFEGLRLPSAGARAFSTASESMRIPFPAHL